MGIVFYIYEDKNKGSADLIGPCIRIYYQTLESLISPRPRQGKWITGATIHDWAQVWTLKLGRCLKGENRSFIYLVILFTLTKKLTRRSWFPSTFWSTHGQALTLLYLHRKCFSVLQLLVLSSCVHLWVRSLPRNSFSVGLKEQRFRKGNPNKYQPDRLKKRKRKNKRYFLT